MTLTRRMTLACALGALAATAAPFSAARAMEVDAAKSFAQSLVDEIAALPASGGAEARARGVSEIFSRRAAVPQITRFVMGQTWRDLSETQQARAQEAVVAYVGRAYVALAADGAVAQGGGALEVQGAEDFGDKGVLVTVLNKAAGGQAASVEFQISDRSGEPKLVDVIAEGVSLLQSQRQEFAAMLERRNGDVDRFLEDLAAGRTLEG